MVKQLVEDMCSVNELWVFSLFLIQIAEENHTVDVFVIFVFKVSSRRGQ